MGKLRTVLLTMVLLGAATSLSEAGTFAGFNATTTNASGTFQTGTLVLSNTVGNGSACFSYGTDPTAISTNANDCDALFSFPPNNTPGAPPFTADVTLRAEGTVEASAFELHVSDPCASEDDSGDLHGVGDLCEFLTVSVQEYIDTAFATPVGGCVFPAAPTACATPPTGRLDVLSAQVTPTSPLALGTMQPGATRRFRVSLAFPSTGPGAQNAVMGKQATFALTWMLSQ